MGIRLELSTRRYEAPELALSTNRLDRAREELLGRIRKRLEALAAEHRRVAHTP